MRLDGSSHRVRGMARRICQQDTGKTGAREVVFGILAYLWQSFSSAMNSRTITRLMVSIAHISEHKDGDFSANHHSSWFTRVLREWQWCCFCLYFPFCEGYFCKTMLPSICKTIGIMTVKDIFQQRKRTRSASRGRFRLLNTCPLNYPIFAHEAK